MSTNFHTRIQQAEELEVPFMSKFNELCYTHKIIKFGIETTKLNELHQYISSSTDPTSQFLRYLPDSVLIPTQVDQSSSPTLIEFKA